MKRIEAYLKGKVAGLKAANREKKVNSSINAAKINFEEQRDDASIKIEELTESLATCEIVTSVIQQISEQMDLKEEAIRGINRMEEIKKYFNEDIEVKEDNK